MLCKKELTITMPYLSTVSVNSAYNRGDPKQGHKPEVDVWLLALKTKLNTELSNSNYLKINKGRGVELDIELRVKKRKGRKPDTSNFRKLPQDLIADCLDVDDWIFTGTDLPLLEGNDTIVFYLTWWYSSNGKDPLEINQSHLYSGPVNSTVRKVSVLGKESYCIGLGTPYCTKCSAVEYCPVEFKPGTHIQTPCKKCDIVCACKGLDDNYEERKQLIEQWWSRRKNAT